MRIARVLAAAALTLGLIANFSAAQAAPPSAPAASSSSSCSPPAAPAKAATKVSVKAATKIKAGKTITITGHLTHKTKHGYTALTKKKVGLLFLTTPGAPVIKQVKTTTKGAYTIRFTTAKRDAGRSFRFATAFTGDAKNKKSVSRTFTVKVTKK